MQDGDEDVVRLAISRLYDIYWPPLYAYLRRRGHTQDVAGDLLQGFFVHLLQHDTLKTTDATRGRFRSFLLTALKNFMHNEQEYANALCRSPADRLLSLDTTDEERGVRASHTSSLTPEEIYEQRWALLVADRAFAKLEKAESRAGRGEELGELSSYLLDHGSQTPYREVAERLGISEANLRVRVHRLRQRLGAALRSEVEQTVSTAAEADRELKLLLQLLEKARGHR